MSRIRYPVAIWVACYCALALTLAITYPALPETMATHFDIHGRPDGSMNRENYLWFITLISLSVPGVVVGLIYAGRFFPDCMINLPNKQHWLAPERRATTFEALSRFGICLACLVLLLMLALHLLTVAANHSHPLRLSQAGIASATAIFLALLAGALVRLYHRFGKMV